LEKLFFLSEKELSQKEELNVLMSIGFDGVILDHFNKDGYWHIVSARLKLSTSTTKIIKLAAQNFSKNNRGS
jgi:hypothetical protein